jgi:hypothetical protein
MARTEGFETQIICLWNLQFVYVLVFVITKSPVDSQLSPIGLRGVCIVTQKLADPRKWQRFARSPQRFVRESIGIVYKWRIYIWQYFGACDFISLTKYEILFLFLFTEAIPLCDNTSLYTSSQTQE